MDSQQHQEILGQLVDYLVQSPVMVYPVFRKPFSLILMRVTKQETGKQEVVAFTSSTLTPAERKSEVLCGQNCPLIRMGY